MSKTSRRSVLKYTVATSALAAAGPFAGTRAFAQSVASPIRIGVLYDLSGPFTGAGSVPGSIGTQIAIDLTNERGGVLGKYKVEPVKGDAQSKVDVALNEAERLISEEKVDTILGIYASAHAVPLAQKMEQAKKILWITIAVATKVIKGKNLTYTFRAGVTADHYGAAAIIVPQRTRQGAARHRSQEPQDARSSTRTAPTAPTPAPRTRFTPRKPASRSWSTRPIRPPPRICPRSSPSSSGQRRRDPAHRLQPRHHAVPAPGARGRAQVQDADRQRRRLQPERQAEGDLRLRPRLFPQCRSGGGAEPEARRRCRRSCANLIKIMVERYQKASGNTSVPPHVSMGFNQSWILLQNVLPVAITKYRRHRSRGDPEGGARRRHPRWRHHPGLWRQIRAARQRDLGPESARRRLRHPGLRHMPKPSSGRTRSRPPMP